MDGNKQAILQSGAFREIIGDVRRLHHPLNTLLPITATTEQRALQQIRCEEFEKIVRSLEILGRENAVASIESTYGVEEPKPKKE